MKPPEPVCLSSREYSWPRSGYGVGFKALMPVVRNKLDISLEGMFGDGIGRYGASRLPDVTIEPLTAEMRPLREARLLLGINHQPDSRLVLYAYGGDEYVKRQAFVSPTGKAAGYESPLVSYTLKGPTRFNPRNASG